MECCIRRSLSTKNQSEKGKRGKGSRESFVIPHFPVPHFPVPPLPYSPFFPFPLVLLDVVSVNPRAVFLLVASLKENIFAVLASHQVHTCINVLL